MVTERTICPHCGSGDVEALLPRRQIHGHDDVFAWAMEQGGTPIREPQHLPHYHEGYYAAFWQDPHGFVLEVVCHRDQSVT